MKKIFFFVAILLVGCSKDDKPEIFPTDSEQVKMIKQADTFIELFNETKTIDLETNDNCLIGMIQKIIITEDNKNIIIYDYLNSTVFVFDANGKFKARIDKQGQGPGEYIQPYNVVYNNGLIYVCDSGGKNHIYDLTGKFIESINYRSNKVFFEFTELVFVDDAYFGYSNHSQLNRSSDKNSYKVIKFDKDNNPVKGFGKGISDAESNFFSGGGFVYYNSLVVYTGLVDGKIYKIDKDDNHELFCDIGKLYDLSEYGRLNYQEMDMYRKKNFKNYDVVTSIDVIKDYLIISRMKPSSTKGTAFTIVNKNGEIFHKLIYMHNYSQLFNVWGKQKNIYSDAPVSNKSFFIYKDGIIEPKLRIPKNNIVENPSLIFYEMKEK